MTDYVEDYTKVNFLFPSKSTAGVPTSITSGAFVAYVGNSTTQITAGLTFTADFDGVTGLNQILIDLSADTAYVAGEDYSVVCTAGTVDSVSVVGEVVYKFSIQNEYMRGTDGANTTVPPTVSAITTDIDNNSTFAPLVTDINTIIIDLIELDSDGDTRLSTKALENIQAFGGAIETVSYLWSTNTATTDPTEGYVKGNNATLVSITELYISNDSNSAGLTQYTLGSLRSGDSILLLNDIEASTFVTFTLDSTPVDNTGWFTLTGAVTSSNGTFTNDNDLFVKFLFLGITSADIANKVLQAGQFYEVNTADVVSFKMVDNSDHITPETGLTVTAQRSIDGGAFATSSGTVSEISNGAYEIATVAADHNGLNIIWRFTATGADPYEVVVRTYAPAT